MSKHYISKLVLPMPSLQFLGQYDVTKQYQIGDVVLKEGQPMVYTGNNHFEVVGSVDDDNATKEEQTEMRCKYCGAPLIKRNNRLACEYCDTQYT